MAAALVIVCVDPRLNHELIRIQVRQRLQRDRIRAERVYILNEVGGNVGANFRQTAQLLKRMGEPIVFCAALHHDDCLAVREGERAELSHAAQGLASELARLELQCPVATGHIRTEHNHVRWSDEREPAYVPFSFG